MSAAQAAPEFDLSSDALSRFLMRDAQSQNADAASDRAGNATFVQQVRSRASEMVRSSMNFLGVPYVRGGTSADSGFDCSGFTRYIFEHSLGLVLPRRADEQAKAAGLVNVRRDELKPGDLVFFNTLRKTFSHVGIYIGEGKFIHSPRSGAEVRVEDMRESYWMKRFTGGRRVPQIEGATSLVNVPAMTTPTVSTRSTASATAASPAYTTSTFGVVPGGSSDPLGLNSNSGASANP